MNLSKYIILSFLLVMSVPALAAAQAAQNIDPADSQAETALRVHDLEQSILEEHIQISYALPQSSQNSAYKLDEQDAVSGLEERLLTSGNLRSDVQEDYPYAARIDPLEAGPLAVTPTSGMHWNDTELRRNMYGQDNLNDPRSNFERHTAESNMAPYLGVALDVDLGEKWSLFSHAEVNVRDDEVSDRSVSDRNLSHSVSTGLVYYF